MIKRKIVLAVTGASGSIYAKQLIDLFQTEKIRKQLDSLALVFSKNAIDVWKHELGNFDEGKIPFRIYGLNDYTAPFASGSARFDTMIVCPCSMGTAGRIAHGISDDLISRAADVIIKEKRKLILVPRETPLSTIHLNNLKILAESGAVICPAIPSFYSNPETISDLVNTVIFRVLDLCGFEIDSYRWNEEDN